MTDGLIPDVTVEGQPKAAALTPTQQIVRDANRIEFGVDARGRKIGVMRLGMSVQRRVMKALSAESGAKSQYFNLAATAACCVSIDGQSVPFPTSELQIDTLIDRLDQEGLQTVASVIAEEFAPAGDREIKNS